MIRLVPRAIAGAIGALLLFIVIGAIVLIAYAGLPKPGSEGAVIDKAGEIAPAVDWIVGCLILFLAGFWAGRPFARDAALKCAGLLGILFIVLTLLIDSSYVLASSGILTDVILPSLVKLLAALAGGWLGAGRALDADETHPAA